MSGNAAAMAAYNARASAGTVGSNPHPITNDPKFQELVRSRNSLALLLSIVMLAIYLAFILLVAFDKPLLATKVGGGPTSLGIVLGLVVIVVAFVLTAFYVVRANGRFDELTADITREFDR